MINNTISSRNIASCNQIHSDNVLFITKPKLYKNIDGLITHIDTKIILKIQTADCIPIFIIDEVSKLIGLIHSGWKGTKKGIIVNAIKIFFQKGSKSNNIKVYLGTSIKSCCYEVKSDVANFFNKDYKKYRQEKIYLDLTKKVKDDLLSLGINNNNISISKVCTFGNKEYCSYRREKENADRMYSLFGAIN